MPDGSNMNNDEWITTNIAAEISGYHMNHIRRLLRAGEIEAKKFGPVWMINKESLLDYMDHTEGKGKKRGPKPRNR